MIEARLREHARALLDAALAAVDPAAAVEAALADHTIAPPPGGRVIVLAVGKAALGMAEGASRALGGSISLGLALAPSGSGGRGPDGFLVFRGAHPLPDEDAVEGARALASAARRAGPADRLLVLLSGGGSALLTLPVDDVSLADVRETTRLLLAAGAPIGELNAVRKHIDQLKGGGLARYAMPAPVRVLVLSDVVGDPLDVIASGPLAPDPTTYADAIAVLDAHGLWARTPETVRRHLVLGREGQVHETPKPGDPPFSGVRTTIVGSVAGAVEAAGRRAEALGYAARVHSVAVTGEAREVGRSLARLALAADAGTALLAGGETTVTVRGDGKGGRNQEVALGAALGLDGADGVLVMSAGTDGVDGPTDAAGALATGTTLERARAAALDPEDHLERNDAYRFFDTLGDLVRTGPTGTNVMDLMVVLVRQP